jgi:hypothetical protein
MVLPVFIAPVEVETDACDHGVGAFLMECGHHKAYMSKADG